MKWLRGSEEGDVVVRGGWAMAYQRPGMSDFTGVFGANQGIQATLQTDQTTTTLPILLRNNPTLPGARRCTLPSTPASITNTRQRLRPEHPAALHAVVVGRLAAQGHARLGDRVALCRQHARERLGHDQHQRAQHHQQRLPQRVPPGAGQPAGQHRRRPRRDVRLHGRRHGHRRRCRSSWRTSTRRTPPTPATPRSTPARNWTSATFLGFLAARNPNPWGFAIDAAPTA